MTPVVGHVAGCIADAYRLARGIVRTVAWAVTELAGRVLTLRPWVAA